MKFKKIFFILVFFVFFSTYCYANNENNTKQINIYSDAAILMDSSSEMILYDKNSSERMYPASTTKVMTAILALENCNLNDKVKVNYSALSSVPSGYSIASLQTDEELTVYELLQVLLVHSANDAANVLAEHISGSISEFSNLMNAKAIELGCTDTHFVNPSGIHNNDHYSTAKDLAIIMKYCMKNSDFRKIVSMPSCTIAETNKSDKRTFTNTNGLIINNSSKSSSNYYYEYCIGGKTGYTSQAKNCLISVSSKDDLELICVILGAAQTENGLSARYIDSKTLYNYGYENFKISSIAKKGDVIEQIEVSNGNKDTRYLDVILDNDILALSNVDLEKNNITYDIKINENISAPLSSGSVVGYITYTVNGIKYEENLIASHDVEKSDFLMVILKLILSVILLILFYIIIKSYFKKNKRKNYKFTR